jgi:hypothetical protein
MTKPQFTIATVQPTDTTTVPKYTLNVELVPDAERRFAVSSNPGQFSESDITVSLNSNGALTGITDTSRELITPTIKAIGDFTTSLIGAAAKVVGTAAVKAVPPGCPEPENTENMAAYEMRKELLKRWIVYTGLMDAIGCKAEEQKTAGKEKKDNEKKEEIYKCEVIVKCEQKDNVAKYGVNKDTVECQDIVKCLEKRDFTKYTPDLDSIVDNWSKLPIEEKEKHKPELNRRLRAAAIVIYQNLQNVPSNNTIANLAAALKPEPTDPPQVNVLKALAKMKVEYKPSVMTPETVYKKQLDCMNKDCTFSSQFAWERKLVVGEVQYAVKNEDIITLFGYSLRKDANSTAGSEAEKTVKNEFIKQANKLATDAVDSVLSTTSFPSLLGPLIKDKTPAQLIYEQVKVVQDKIVKKKAQLVRETDPNKRKKYQEEIKKLTDTFFETIGAKDEYNEILKLQEIIKKGPPKAANVAHSSPLQEYAAARAQLAALNEAVTLKLGKVAADAAETPPAKQPEWSPVPVDVAFCWNIPRERMEKKEEPSRRILVPVDAAGKPKPPAPPDSVAARVALDYTADIDLWPKYVVVIDEVKPFEKVKP